ncbi:hypothetical protein [Streptomyces sp. SBT349]|uniref:hypothetical protein n=1 Tax=Streptomyces sp. SBT349 TaxID=1580539 RepID=UPI00131BB172|nr:hypothetical protein [Streptomyces sp. SBT349]
MSDVPADAVVSALETREPPFETVIREGLIARGHDLAGVADDQISALFGELTAYHPRLTTAMELPSSEEPSDGTRLQWGAEWAHRALKVRCAAAAGT